MASRCQRSILSCSRCRKRKMKCGRQLPSCSQCVAAKANCTGISANATATDVPRSIVQHLESEIAWLETQLTQDGRLDMDIVHASDILLKMPSMPSIPSRPDQPGEARLEENRQEVAPQTTSGTNDHRNGLTSLPNLDPWTGGTRHQSHNRDRDQDRDLRSSILSGKPLQAIVSATLPYGSGATGLLSRVRMGLTPSAAQVGERGRTPAASHANHKTSKGSSNNILLDATILRSIPADIVHRLIRKYLDTVQQDHPFLVASTVVQQFRNVAQILGWPVEEQEQEQQDIQSTQTANMQIMANHDFLIIYLVLAISVTLGSASDGHQERCMALSMSLFEEGIQHFYSLPSFPSDIAWLQTILLILLYATIFPRSANVWVLSGAAMRAYLELGLHREPPDESLVDGMDPETLHLRRRVFWAAYCMDRSICSALQRPLSTPDAAINTKLPAQLGDDDTFLGSIEYHRLLSEILHVHFQREPIPNQLTWDDWLTNTENSLRAWHRQYGSTSRPSSHHHEMIEFNMARGLMILHRPSPRVPTPSARSLLIAFEAASTAARIHREHIRAGFFRRPWLSAHHALEAATVVLFCLRHGSEAITARFTASHVFDMTKLFTSNLLAIAAQGWPEVSVYASVYERLLGPLLERVFLGRLDLSEAFGPAQDAELVRLLYPGPAHLEKLRFGWRQQQQNQEELSPFDFTLFMEEDFWTASGGLDVEVGEGGTDHGDGQRWDFHGAEFEFGIFN
ncbi:fungal-specific transcription factor domain-containing protein [Annulohypoxylon moriforme]|nr:fungal-specific transcription factor domain-containing protein [Annulohypoxylon moriforme]